MPCLHFQHLIAADPAGSGGGEDTRTRWEWGSAASPGESASEEAGEAASDHSRGATSWEGGRISEQRVGGSSGEEGEAVGVCPIELWMPMSWEARQVDLAQ